MVRGFTPLSEIWTLTKHSALSFHEMLVSQTRMAQGGSNGRGVTKRAIIDATSSGTWKVCKFFGFYAQADNLT